MGGKKDNGSVVKIDSALLEKVEEFISKDENRLKFVNKKHFIDLAVNDFLEKLNENGGKNRGRLSLAGLKKERKK